MIDTSNDCFVGTQGGDVVILLPPTRMDKDMALRLAAWLVALADDEDRFPAVLDAVRNT